MKINKLILMFAVSVVFALTGCDNGAEKNETGQEQADLPAELKGMVPLDLSEHGMPLLVMIPDSTVGMPEIEAQSWGETEIRVGDQFQIVIAEGGDIALRKSDIKEDLLYKGTILEEAEDHLLYKQEIDGASVEPMHHFYMLKEFNGVTYEIQDIPGNSYTKKAIERMHASASHIQHKPAS